MQDDRRRVRRSSVCDGGDARIRTGDKGFAGRSVPFQVVLGGIVGSHLSARFRSSGGVFWRKPTQGGADGIRAL